jgi:hypothetical protein
MQVTVCPAEVNNATAATFLSNMVTLLLLMCTVEAAARPV